MVKYSVLQGVLSYSGSGDYSELKKFDNYDEAKKFFNEVKFNIKGYSLKRSILSTSLIKEEEGEKFKSLDIFDLDIENIKVDYDFIVTKNVVRFNIYDEVIKIDLSNKIFDDLDDIARLIEENWEQFQVFREAQELVKFKVLDIVENIVYENYK